jgi:hypothetical protein
LDKLKIVGETYIMDKNMLLGEERVFLKQIKAARKENSEIFEVCPSKQILKLTLKIDQQENGTLSPEKQ